MLYVCDLDQVPDFKQMYELYDPVTLMFFFRNKHMMCDFGTGNNNKLNWVLEDKQELIDIIETIYRGAKKGRGLVVSPKGEFFASFSIACLVRGREAERGALTRNISRNANKFFYHRLLDPIQILDMATSTIYRHSKKRSLAEKNWK